MFSASPRAFPLLWIAAATLCSAPTAHAWQAAAPAPPTVTAPSPAPASPPSVAAPLTPAQQAQGEQALAFILKHEVLDPNAIVPGTGKPLPTHGIWSVGKQRPPACPKDQTEPCILILYRVPDAPIACEWVVILKPDGVNGAILAQNPDSIRYMLRIVPAAEAAPLVVARQTELNSRGSTRVAGVVEVGMIISTTGEPNRIFPVSGPDNLRPAAVVIAKQWIFRPLTINGRAIPYETVIKFTFGNGKVVTEP